MELLSLHTFDDRLQVLEGLVKTFHDRAAKNDKEGRFPFENIEDLKRIGYTRLTLPKEYGGAEISLFDFVRFQETIAIGDGATALSIGWHMGNMMNLTDKRNWDEKLFSYVSEEVRKGALLNVCATEPQTGSPTRGGKPTTTAKQQGDVWVINGRKSFTTMSPVLDFFIVSATIEDSDDVAFFLIPRNTPGLSIDETWDSVAMRASGSHDLVMENVEIPIHFLTEKSGPRSKSANGWLLHIPACYLGIAEAAKREAAAFAKSYTPNSLNHPIFELPAIQQKFGEIELKLIQSRHFLYSVAKMWDEGTTESRNNMNPELGAVKLTVTNQAVEIVDLAMRIVGARSLSEKSPLQRYYRDVRAGLHNPPMDDMTLMQLAKRV
ncbi:acyl-CoA dehydrogenase [Heyndrickxia shackletonii]|uniref:Acyl-CoA dehydrogenase n=1 Tax=Heyndrickxia shackletonii TaxID=157838 RepID=A0A0Q3TEP8_9BACI|nr:acyl-CoA dehydrogenase family protein [Heyndrickxia shackletonii]KQL52568.1 acyl-CoA dehydrogenase [Heyndrickxia shackletonii]NEZ02454.1 acyl-CoA/acyl-ACP dehydrogenase [Heyndrickxia shackletonii]